MSYLSIIFCIRLFDILYLVHVIKDAQILTTASARLQKISRKRNHFGYLHATVIAKGIFLSRHDGLKTLIKLFTVNNILFNHA